MKIQSLRQSFPWWGPLLFLVAIAPFTASWDLELSRYIFQQESFSTHPFFQFFYLWGEIPALTLAFVSLLVVAAGFFVKKARTWRKEALYLLLTFIVGSGIITNVLLKEYWGRPRPKQVTEFGGTQEFRPFYSPNFYATEPAKSFPCGHCTTGFYFFSLVFLGRRLEKKWLTLLGWVLAIGLGAALSASRIFQGGHFLTDTFVGAMVMWYTALILDWLLYSET